MNVRLALAVMIAMGGATIASADDKPAMPMDPQAKAMQDWQQQLSKMFDADGDGKLSDQEKLMAQEVMRQHGWNVGMMPGGFPGAEQFQKQFDRNGDGKIDQMEAMMAQQMFARMRNHNGGRGGGVRVGGGGGSGFAPQPAMPFNPQAGGEGNGGASKLNNYAKRFDKDGDGKLNAEEKAAAQAELKKTGKDAKKPKK